MLKVSLNKLLQRELWHDNMENELSFLIGGRSCRFGRIEFCLITSLSAGSYNKETLKARMHNNSIHSHYFRGQIVTSNSIQQVLLRGN